MFSVANYYDTIGEVDSSHKYYNMIINTYPDTDQYMVAKNRLFILNAVLSLSNQDTLKSDLKK